MDVAADVVLLDVHVLTLSHFLRLFVEVIPSFVVGVLTNKFHSLRRLGYNTCIVDCGVGLGVTSGVGFGLGLN